MKLSEYLKLSGETPEEYQARKKRESEGKTTRRDYIAKTRVELATTDISDIYESLTKGGYIDPETLSSYGSRLDDYIKKYSYINKYTNSGKSEYLDSLNRLRSGVSDYYDVISKYASEDEYNYSVNTQKEGAEGVEARKKWYEDLNKKIEELNKEIPWYGKTPVIGDVFIGEDTEGKKDKLEELKALKNQYERNQKVTDDYYQPITPEFEQNAAFRDYNNPTKDELWGYDLNQQDISVQMANGGWYDGEYYRDAKGNIINEIEKPVIEDKLGLYLSASSEDKTTAYSELQATNGNYRNTWASLIQEGDTHGWDYLEESEIDIYYDLLKREGQEAAYKFLSDMETELGRRENEKIQEEISGANALQKIAYNIASVPMNVLGGIPGFIDDASHIIQGEEINPYSRAHFLSNTAGIIRNDTSDIINNATGNASLPWIGTTFGDVYQSIMSGADTLFGSAFGSTGYGIMMGLNSATAEAKKLYEQGASTAQIAAGSILSGAAEMIFEKMSLEYFFKNFLGSPAKSKAQLVMKILAQGGIEASEEVATEIANTITNAAVMGSQSDIQKYIDNYISQGYSKGEATVKALFSDIAPNVINAGIGGFISGGAIGGAGAVINYNKYNNYLKENGEGIIEMGGVDALQKLAIETAKENKNNKKLERLVDKVGEKPTAKNVGLLDEEVDRYRTKNNQKSIENSVIEQMVKDGVKIKDAKKKAGKIAEILLKKYNGEEVDISEALKDESVKKVYDNVIQNSDSEISRRDEHHAEVRGGIVDNYVNNKIEEYVKNNSEQPSTASVNIKDVIKDIGNEGINQEALKLIESEYDGSIPADEYIYGMKEGYKYGFSGVPKSAIPENGYYSKLSEMQKDHAYRLGKSDAESKADGRKSEISSGKKTGDHTVGRKKGVVKGEGVTISDLKSTFNDTQNIAYKILSTVAEATGIDIVLYQTKSDDNGNFLGNQGKFKYKDDTIYIDINAGLKNIKNTSDLGKYAMLRTFSHEFVHFIEKWNPKEYNKFRELVFNALQERGESVNDLIEAKMAIDGLSYDKASREVVAEAMTDILPDTNFVQTLAEKNKNVFGKLIEKLKEFIENIKIYFNSIGSNKSREANALKEERDGQLRYLQSIVDTFDKIAVEAVENYQMSFDEANEESTTTEIKANTVEAKSNSVSATTTSEYGFTITDNTEYNSIEIKFDGKPSEAIRNVLKENKFRWHKQKGVWYGKAERTDIVKALREAYQAENQAKEHETKPATEKTATEVLREMGGRAVSDNMTDVTDLFFPALANTNNEEVIQNGTGNLEIQGPRVRGETVREDNNGAVSSPESNGKGTSRLLDELQTGDVQRAGGQRETVGSSSKRRGQDKRDRDQQPSHVGDSRSDGTGESGDIRRDDGLTEDEKQAKAEELHETVIENIEQRSTETPKGRNFTIGETLNLPNGEKSRFRANIDAIKLVKKIESEGRYATTAEQEVLSKYVGWGGLSDAFGEMTYNRETNKREMTAKKGWESEFAEFRKLVEDGIITEEEYKAASASTKNAHYTSIEVIKAMYDGLAQLGFNGGRMLEPSSGVGNFVGAMPTNMSSKVNSWTMVELDSITGLIAKYLYPNADVRIQGFEKANIPDNYMDVAIGNVPFGNYGVVDRSYPNRVTKSMHNYFFAKSLDKVRPGGIVMFITSSFTMDGQNKEIRQYIMDRADLLGAIRLPNNTFAGNAGTQVVTDILILKKRNAGTAYSGESFLDTNYQQFGNDYYESANINVYFANHPEMVLGKPTIARGMYSANSLTYKPLESKVSIGDQIREAFKNITAKMDYPVRKTPEKANFDANRANKKTKYNAFEVKNDGTVYKNVKGTLQAVTDKDTSKRIIGLLDIRDSYRTLVNYLLQGQSENLVKKARKDLNTAYDKFVKEYGYINSPKNKSAITDDPDSYSIYALENYDVKKKTATKSDIFTKDTIKPNKTITHVDDIESGIIVSINTTGRVDSSLIAKLTNKTVADVERELIDGRMAFKRRDGSLEAPETYLAGNVRAKLREAEALAPIDKDFQNNVDELKKVIPEDIPFSDIYVTPGSPWIPTEVYADFIAEMLGGRNDPNSYRGPDVVVGRSNQTGDFKITLKNPVLKNRYQNTQQWGTKRRTFLDLMQALMSSSSLTVNDTVETSDGKKKSVINKVETAAAQAKAEEITKEFQDWLWRDENRRKDLATLYNETYNALVNPKYSGKHLTVNGLNADFTLREHQANAVQRIISSGGNTLIAHKVGAGKTLEMAAAAMKLRELGIVKKPIFVVPKSLVAQWGVEFKDYFPASKLLVADEKSFTKDNRKTFANKIANGDFDAVIVSYEQFEKIPMSAEFQKKFYQQQIDEILTAIAEEKAETNGKGLTVKEMEKKKSQLERKISELNKKEKDIDNIDFEELGIDSLFVDEAHNFKNLQYVTRMNNISGLGNTNGSQRAFDLFTKIRYLQQLNGGRGIVFATATPVMNSMAEMYIMQKYLQSDMLNQLNLSTFDAWAKQFGEVVNSVEIKPSGQGFRVKQTFSNFKNLNELQLLFRSFADVLTDVPGLKIPKMKGGSVKTVVCEPSNFQKEYMKQLEKRADNIKNVDPSEDNMLKITSDGRKLSYTQRMIDPSLPYEPGCKIFRCCDNVITEYKDSDSIKGTQIIFCDMATPKGKSKTENASTDASDDSDADTESAKLYDDMKSYLVKKGIPANEIAFIHDADTDVKKKQLFADVNEGKVRVLIGSTGKMGVGMNAQERIVAIHHLDAPWRPGDVEQRDGRAFRQKNMNDEVSKYIYVTEGSFDARLWDILDRKQHFINQIMNGEDIGRTAEDTGDVTLSAAEVKALASGNPLIMEQVQLSTDLQKLEDLQKAYKSSIITAKTKQLDDIQKIASFKKSIENARADIKSRIDTYSDSKFSMEIGGRKYTDKKEAGIALSAEIASKARQGEYASIGKFSGFELRVIKDGPEYFGSIIGHQSYKFNVYVNNTTHMVNHIIDIVSNLESKISAWEAGIKNLEDDLSAQERMIAEPFSKQEELDKKRKRFEEVMSILNPAEEQQMADDDSNDQNQSREYLDESVDNAKKKKYNKRSYYSQAETQFMIWENGSAPVGEVKSFFRFGKHHFYEKTENGCIELSAKQYEERKGRNVTETFKRAGIGVSKASNNDGDQGKGSDRNNAGNREHGGTSAVSRQTLGEKLRNDAGGSVPSIRRSNNGTDVDQNQSRTDTLTDREVLEIASNEITIDDLTAGEKEALGIFQNRLGKLKDLQDERTKQGKLYKEQQFGAKADRNAAAETLNRMHILDDQIKKASAELLSVEEKEVLKRVLQKSRKVIEKTEREHGKEMLDRWRERRRDADEIKKYRSRVKADVDELTKWILKPDNKDIVKRVPDALKNTVIPFLSSIDFTSKRQLKGGDATKSDKDFLKKLTALQSAIKKNIDLHGLYSGYNDLPPDFMDDLQKFIDVIRDIIDKNSGTFVINQMSGSELKDLSKIVRTLKKFIMQMNMFHSNAMFKHIYEAGDATMSELRKMKNASDKVGGVSNFFLWKHIRPSYAFERFGEGGKAIERELRMGNSKYAFNFKTLLDFSEKTFSAEEVKTWEKEGKVFMLGGDEVRIPFAYIMYFYLLSKQPDSLRHILGEGVRVATYKDGVKTISDNGHKLTESDVRIIVDSLSQKQKEVADALQKFMATQGAAWGNEVSVKRFGEELFNNPLYCPIITDDKDSSDKKSNEVETPARENQKLYALLNMSFTKQRNENANNRIMLYSIFDVFSEHMISMARYNAFALPILDTLKWFNYKETMVDSAGNTVVTGDLRKELQRVYGMRVEKPNESPDGYAEHFIKGIVKGLSGTDTQGISDDALAVKMLRTYNIAQIGFNSRVVVQQPISIVRAGMIVDFQSILKGLKLSPSAVKANIEEMQAHNGIALWKSLGFYDVNVSRGMTDTIKHNNNVMEKIGDAAMWAAEKADEITWSAIWSACKEEVSRKNPGIDHTSKKFFDKVNDLFDEVIYKTQVVDSVLTKSEFMRSKGFVARAFSSFMSEAVTSASMVIGAYDQFRRDIQSGMSIQQAWLKNRGNITRTCAVFGINAVLLAAVQSVIDAFRYDDDDKEWIEQYGSQFLGNVIDELMPFNKLPFMSDLYDIFKQILSAVGVDTYGNPPQVIIAQWYDSLVKGTAIIYKKVSGKNTSYTTYAGIYKLLQAVSGMIGLPIAPAVREVVTVWNLTVGNFAPNLEVKMYSSNN